MNKKHSGRIAFLGILSALALVCLLITVTPVATITLAALAGLCGIPIVSELGRRTGTLHYVAVSLLSLLLIPAWEGKLMYVAFFGWYTVFKAWLENKNLPRLGEWGIKYGVFIAGLMVYSAVWVFILKMPVPAWSWVIPVSAVGLCAVFAVYDWCLTGLATAYMRRLHPLVTRLFHFS